MPLVKELERKILKNALTIDELSIQIETLNRNVDDLLNDLNVTSDQLSAFIQKKEHFTEEDWNALSSQQKALDEKLLRELINISNPQKTKKTYSERNIPPHWLFVR